MTQSTVSATFSLNHRLPRPPGSYVERRSFATTPSWPAASALAWNSRAASAGADGVGRPRGAVGGLWRQDPASSAVAVDRDGGAFLFVLGRGGPAVGLEPLIEILRDLRQHRQEGDPRAYARRGERGGPAA